MSIESFALDTPRDQSHEPSRHDTFVERLGSKLGATANARTIFGDAVERNGITVIPVAKVRYGFGGGGGRKQNEEGSGGGGGAQVSPIGYIELKDGSSSFRPINDLAVIVPVVLAGGFTALVILKRLFKMLR